MSLEYDIGDRVELRAAFRDSTGAFADPTEVTFRVKDADGSVTVYTYGGATVTKIETGKYRVYITPTISGEWSWRAEATGDVVDTVEAGFRVRESEIVDG